MVKTEAGGTSLRCEGVAERRPRGCLLAGGVGLSRGDACCGTCRGVGWEGLAGAEVAEDAACCKDK